MGSKKLNIAVFASGKGTNFQAIINAVKKGKLNANLALLVCDNPQAIAIKKANAAGIKVALVKRQECLTREDFENKIIAYLKKSKIGLIVMAGFMRVLSPLIVRRYKNMILNIHPSLLPGFKGGHAIADAVAYGVKVIGVTVHFADELMDHGPIILQEAVTIRENDTLSSLEERIHRLEHRLYPKAIDLFLKKSLKIVKRKVRIINP